MAVVNEESVLRCSVTGFYPVDIDIKWFKDGEELNNISTEDPQRNSDRTYSVKSAVTITPTEEDLERIFSCRVYHDFLHFPLQKDFRLVYEEHLMPQQEVQERRCRRAVSLKRKEPDPPWQQQKPLGQYTAYQGGVPSLIGRHGEDQPTSGSGTRTLKTSEW
ncbi:unnamed protein product [Ranitomeya imitator]|uniref:Ig-like domain-containing protein n=1 Tax=Ranitomeya imitator TaxID=111125 RepID=A0ABN9KTU8_9NEOB|nr:unnamed protein product [Ranitomeya imitator]